MDPKYIQHLRYKLQKRVARLNSVQAAYFVPTLVQFMGYFDDVPTFTGIVELLLTEFPELDKIVDQILDEKISYMGNTENEAAALGYLILRKISEQSLDKAQNELRYVSRAYGYDPDDKIEVVREIFLEPFYEYIDEQLDDQRAMLMLLLRYKHRSEWFRRDHLWELSQIEQKGEKELALDLYAYLFDQGLDFHIEPSSITGAIDLIAAQDTEDPLLLDTKIFEGDKRGKAYICKGFQQIYTYCQQYNEPFGYLVIYKTTDRDIHFALETTRYSNTPVMSYNNKSIFFLVIDIFPHEKPVSQRSPIKMIEITDRDLAEAIRDAELEKLLEENND